ncbi:MAG: LPS export ABC transporter periplasmic protein LptC [Candidatus Omnitrophota bacterium]
MSSLRDKKFLPIPSNLSVLTLASALILALLLTPGLLAQEVVTQQVDGFTLEGFDENGQRSWEVNGQTADIFGDTIKILNVDANTYGEQEVNLKADTGEVDKKSGNVHLQDNVVITTREGSQLKTDSLDWEKEKNLVVTEDSAEITDKAIKATGVGLTAHPELKTAQLEKNIVVEVEAEKADSENQKEQIVITCDGPMELDQRNNLAILKENVVAIRGDETLKADLVEVFFDPVTRRIVSIICTDNVSVQRGDNISYADKAVYNAADQKVIFIGRPKLIMTSEEKNKSFF